MAEILQQVYARGNLSNSCASPCWCRGLPQPVPEPLPYVPTPLVQKSHVSHEKDLADCLGLPLCERYVHNRGMIYGYARVSTDGQSVEAQVVALTAAGAVTVYREVASSAKTAR